MASALRIEDIHKNYDGVPAVRGLSLSIEPGEIFGLLGPNGAGKSTTINMVAGVTRLDRGRISIFGHDNQSEYRTTRRLTGVMHQEIVTDAFFTIDRALKIHAGYYGVPDDPAWRRRLIDQLGLGPHLGKPMIKLSGGMKRRFMVAKALIHRPRMLILDEPTAGVDVELRHNLWEFVKEINGEGTTVLLTTHYLEEAEQMCGRIAIMNHGELIALEKKEELLARLGERSFSIRLAEPLTAVPGALAPYAPELSQGGRMLSLAAPSGGTAGEILAILDRLGLTVNEIETRKAGLEEIFIEMTGMKLKDRRKDQR